MFSVVSVLLLTGRSRGWTPHPQPRSGMGPHCPTPCFPLPGQGQAWDPFLLTLASHPRTKSGMGPTLPPGGPGRRMTKGRTHEEGDPTLSPTRTRFSPG